MRSDTTHAEFHFDSSSTGMCNFYTFRRGWTFSPLRRQPLSDCKENVDCGFYANDMKTLHSASVWVNCEWFFIWLSATAPSSHHQTTSVLVIEHEKLNNNLLIFLIASGKCFINKKSIKIQICCLLVVQQTELLKSNENIVSGRRQPHLHKYHIQRVNRQAFKSISDVIFILLRSLNSIVVNKNFLPKNSFCLSKV